MREKRFPKRAEAGSEDTLPSVILSKQDRRKMIKLGLLIVLAAALPLLGLGTLWSVGQDWVEWIRDRKFWLLPVFLITAGIGIGLALSPSHLTSLISGYLYGLVLGAVVALAVILLGAATGAVLSRRWSGDVLRGLINRSRWGRVLAEELIDATPAKAVTTVALARLPPQVPFAMGNFVAASCRIPLGPLLLGTGIGMLPRVFLVVWVGASLAEWAVDSPPPHSLAWAIGFALAGFLGLGFWAGAALRRRTRETSGGEKACS